MIWAESGPIQELFRVLTARKLEPNPKPKFNEAGGGAQSFFFLFSLAPIYTRPERKKKPSYWNACYPGYGTHNLSVSV